MVSCKEEEGGGEAQGILIKRAGIPIPLITASRYHARRPYSRASHTMKTKAWYVGGNSTWNRDRGHE